MNEPLVWFAERGCPQANRVTLTKFCRCNNSSGDYFAHHDRPAGVVTRFAGSIESSPIAASASRPKAPGPMNERFGMTAPLSLF
jgi:hypothetical protein